MSNTSKNFKRRELLATENMLQFGAGKHFTITPDYRYFFWNSDFTITMLLANFTNGTVITAQGSDGARFSVAYAGANALDVLLKTDAGTEVMFNLRDIVDMEKTVFRFSLIRRGSVVEAWINNRQVMTASTLDTFETITFDQSIIVGNADVCVSNLVFILAAPLVDNMFTLHTQNIVPEYLRRFVVAHYPLNERRAVKAFDICEQYNPGKAIFFGPAVPPLTIYSGSPQINTGSDAGGNYIEYAAGTDAGPGGVVNAATSGWQVYPDISFDPVTRVRFVRGTVKLKLIGPVNSGFSFSIIGRVTQVNSTTDATDVILTKSVRAMFTNSSGQMDLTVDYRSTTPGMKVRIYSVELAEERNTANHCDLIGFTAEELGQTSLLAENAWKNVFQKGSKGTHFWKASQPNSYAVVENFGPVVYPDFTIAVSFRTPDFDNFGVYPTVVSHLFTNVATAYKDYVVGIRPNNLGQIDFLNGLGANAADSFTGPGQLKRYVIVCKNGGSYAGGYMRLYTTKTSYYESGTPGPFGAFDELNFSKFSPPQETEFGRFIMLNKAADDHEIGVLMQHLDTDEYKNLSNIIMDFDFGCQDDSGTYGRDYTGNYALRLFNNVASDPVSPLDYRGLPPRNKALRFTNNHWLEIPGFAPTGEKGYTFMYQFTLDTNRQFRSYDMIMGVRQASDIAKLIFGDGERLVFYNHEYMYTYPIRTDKSKIMTVAVTERDGLWRIYLNGVFVAEQTGALQPLPTINGPFCIGKDTHAPYWFNGNMTFVGVWKGILSDGDIYTLSQNQDIKPSADCQLYLLFDEIKRAKPLYNLTNIVDGWTIRSGDPVVTYGTDADGAYVQIETGADAQSFIAPAVGAYPHTVGRKYISNWKMKIMTDPYFCSIRIEAQPTDTSVGSLSGDPIGTIFTKSIPYTASAHAYISPLVFLFGSSIQGQRIRIYGITVEEADPYYIPDYSPQNNRVVMNGYTVNELDPQNAAYALIARDALR